MLAWTISNLAPGSDEAEQLPVLSHKFPFSVEAFLQMTHKKAFKSCNDCGVAEGNSRRVAGITGLISIPEQSMSLPKR